MNNSLYPNDWPTIAREVKAANDWRCIACDKQCRRPGEFWLGWEYELTCAHLCQDYEADAVCVAALCVACHLRHDAPLSWWARRRRERVRRRLAGQLALALNASLNV